MLHCMLTDFPGVIEEVSEPPVSGAAVVSPLTSPVKKPPPESPSKVTHQENHGQHVIIIIASSTLSNK